MQRGSTINLNSITMKKYIIKNINEFLYRVDNKFDYEYGKNLVFNHYIKNFDEQSILLIKEIYIKLKNEYY